MVPGFIGFPDGMRKIKSPSPNGPNPLQDFHRPIGQRDPVFGASFHPLARHRPHPSVHVDFVPPGETNLTGASGGQDQEMQRAPDSGRGWAGFDCRHDRGRLAIVDGVMMVLVGLRRKRTPKPASGDILRNEIMIEAPFEHRADTLAGIPTGGRLRDPKRLDDCQHVRRRDPVNRRVADMREDVPFQHGQPFRLIGTVGLPCWLQPFEGFHRSLPKCRHPFSGRRRGGDRAALGRQLSGFRYRHGREPTKGHVPALAVRLVSQDPGFRAGLGNGQHQPRVVVIAVPAGLRKGLGGGLRQLHFGVPFPHFSHTVCPKYAHSFLQCQDHLRPKKTSFLMFSAGFR